VDRSEPIGVLVADDDPLYRSVVASVLAAERDIEVVAEARTGQEAAARAVDLAPDVALLDVRMPVLDGIEAAAAIQEAVPTTRIVMLTTSDEDDHVYGALCAGASGYLLKDQGLDGLADVVRTVASGLCMVLSPAVTGRLLAELRSVSEPTAEAMLSRREIEVLGLVSRGLTNQEIAQELSLSEHTVKRHVANILAKLHQRSRWDAVNVAVQEGLLGS
jgi:DNA-binding NarL/FixJ family response regulator